MRIAIFGANSLISLEFIDRAIKVDNFTFDFYTRKKHVMETRLQLFDNKRYQILGYERFSNATHYDVILNFIGCGDPKKLKQMQSDIIYINDYFDNKILNYLKTNQSTKYIYLSSGASHLDDFESPIVSDANSTLRYNEIRKYDHYSLAKKLSEIRHRAYSDFAIVDLRVFNYLRETEVEIENSLIGDIFACISHAKTLYTNAENIWRDYIDADLFYNAVMCILESDHINNDYDLYSCEPIDKNSLLQIMKNHFGLRYYYSEEDVMSSTTGTKPRYYSLDKKISSLGYKPCYNSKELIIRKAQKTFIKNI